MRRYVTLEGQAPSARLGVVVGMLDGASSPWPGSRIWITEGGFEIRLNTTDTESTQRGQFTGDCPTAAPLGPGRSARHSTKSGTTDDRKVASTADSGYTIRLHKRCASAQRDRSCGISSRGPDTAQLMDVFPSRSVLSLFGSAIDFGAASRDSVQATLGANYGFYHRVIALRLAALTPRPDPRVFRDYEAYLDACRAVVDVLVAEVFLRQCRASVLSLDVNEGVYGVPLVDSGHRLLSQVTRTPEPDVVSTADPGWRPLLATPELMSSP